MCETKLQNAKLQVAMGSLCARRRSPIDIQIKVEDQVPVWSLSNIDENDCWIRSEDAHVRALNKLRKTVGEKMKFLGALRKMGQARTEVGDAVKNWEWMTLRKLHARQFQSSKWC